LVLAVSGSLWHFWLSASLTSFMFNVNNGVGSALVADLVPPASLGRGMSLFVTTIAAAGIPGFTGAGQAIEHLGMTSTLVLGAFLALIAIILLIPIREAVRQEAAVKIASV
jgi:predicted MFS family arabinose efflux permease